MKKPDAVGPVEAMK